MDTRLPVEILTEIFVFLTPPDLYSLTLVCKNLRSLLWSTTAKSTQRIWRMSRLNYDPFICIQPPILRITTSSDRMERMERMERMSEQQYFWLMILCKKCQFCNQTNERELNMYWEGKVYCCGECLKKRVISGETLKSRWNVPDDFLLCLTELSQSYDTACWGSQIFFKSEVIRLSKEYEQLKKHEINDWFERKKSTIIKLKELNEKYRVLFELCRYDYVEMAKRKLHRRTLHQS